MKGLGFVVTYTSLFTRSCISIFRLKCFEWSGVDNIGVMLRSWYMQWFLPFIFKVSSKFLLGNKSVVLLLCLCYISTSKIFYKLIWFTKWIFILLQRFYSWRKVSGRSTGGKFRNMKMVLRAGGGGTVIESPKQLLAAWEESSLRREHNIFEFKCFDYVLYLPER